MVSELRELCSQSKITGNQELCPTLPVQLHEGKSLVVVRLLDTLQLEPEIIKNENLYVKTFTSVSDKNRQTAETVPGRTVKYTSSLFTTSDFIELYIRQSKYGFCNDRILRLEEV